ncbi:phage baseplate protein [Aeromonas enteropelogenes]|uniref:phage baseplate protein n=1 Tax=Aeromonas enteropelogenes TaxID=29489 RepID=UPI00398941ED
MPNYTMFISGNKHNKTQQSTSDSDIVMIFDSVQNYNISLQNEKTQYAIESRSDITDHVFSPDGKFRFTAVITTAPYYVNKDVEWDKNTDINAPKSSDRISKAYDVLKAARDSRSAISLEFEEGSISNYVITDLDMSREGPLDQMVFSVTLTEMRKVTVGRTVLAMNVGESLSNSAKETKNLGNKNNKVDDFNRRAEITKPAINPHTSQFKFFEQNLKK